MKREPALHIDIVSDVVCPWCVIGAKSLEQALIETGQLGRATVRFRPFELNPWMPAEGQDLREHLRQKYGSTPEQGRRIRERITALGADLGFTYRFTDDMRMQNTWRAHQLLHWAAETGDAATQWDLKMALFEAYFTRGEDVNDVSRLASIAAGVGLAEDEAESMLYDERYADVVRSEEQAWRDRGIHAVPSVVLGGRMLITGAQDRCAYVQGIERALERLTTDEGVEALA